MDIGVYKIELNKKLYIGSSAKGIEKRWSQPASDPETDQKGDSRTRHVHAREADRSGS